MNTGDVSLNKEVIKELQVYEKNSEKLGNVKSESKRLFLFSLGM